MFNRKNHDASKTERQNEGGHLNRRSLLKRSGVISGAVALASTLSITPFSPVHASAKPDVPRVNPLSRQEAEPYIQAVLDSAEYRSFKQSVQEEHAGIFAIQEQEATAFHITRQQSTLVAVRIPVIGGAGYSAYSATFSPDTFTIASTLSGLFSLIQEKNVYALLRKDGQVWETTFAPNGDLLSGTVRTKQGTVTSLKPRALAVAASDCGWGCFPNCLVGPASAPSWVAGAALTICGAVCALGWILNPACNVCLTVTLVAFVGGFAFDIGYCIGYCTCW